MKMWIAGFCLLVLFSACFRSTADRTDGKESTTVDAACGQCLLGLSEKKRGCDLAVRLDGMSYFVDGFQMRELGDSDAEDGMCNIVRQAKVTGKVVEGRFLATTFEVLPLEE